MWLDKMYLFKQDTLPDEIIDAKVIDKWKQLLTKYDESLKQIITPKHKKKIDLQTIQEQNNQLLQQKK